MLAIGRALMANPELILMDEPSEGLSPRLVQQAQGIMQRLRRGHAILLVEQNLQLALSVADELYVLSSGRFVFQGPPPISQRRRRFSISILGRRTENRRTRRMTSMATHRLGPTPATVHWGYSMRKFHRALRSIPATR